MQAKKATAKKSPAQPKTDPMGREIEKLKAELDENKKRYDAVQKQLKAANSTNEIEWKGKKYTVNVEKLLGFFDQSARQYTSKMSPLLIWHKLAEILHISTDEAKKIMGGFHG